MSEIGEPGALANAEGIIERFGGIRPMASKMAIPSHHRAGLEKAQHYPQATAAATCWRAARINAIDLSGLITRGANENGTNEKRGGHGPRHPASRVMRMTSTIMALR